jgi:hypothetical protein
VSQTDYTFKVDFTNGPLTALASASWTDISDRLISGSIKRGRQFELDQFQPGGGSLVLDNVDRQLEPGYASSSYYPNLLPLRKCQLLATAPGGSARPIFTGYIVEWPPIWEQDNSEVTVTLVDAFELLAIADLTGTFAGVASGTRVGDVLDAIGWPGADRTLATGVASLLAETWVDEDNQKALAHLQDVHDTEAGALFVGKDGKFVFQDRNTRRSGSYLTAQMTVSDFAVVGSKFPAAKIYPSFDRTRLYNDIKITARGGTTQTAADSTSQTMYGRRTFTREILADTDLQASDLAMAILSQRANPSLRFDGVDLEPWYDDGSHWAGYMDAILARDISDRITVEANPPSHPGSTTPVAIGVHIEAIEHTFAVAGHHEINLQLSPVDPTSYWVLDTSVLDTNTVLAF